MEKKREDLLDVPFVFTINHNPAVAQISVKGRAHVTGERDELTKIHRKLENPRVVSWLPPTWAYNYYA